MRFNSGFKGLKFQLTNKMRTEHVVV